MEKMTWEESSPYMRDMYNNAATRAYEAEDCRYQAAFFLATPSGIYRPRLSIDGNQWCALYGENLQDGVAGFGDSPAEAYAAFDVAWREKLPAEDSSVPARGG